MTLRQLAEASPDLYGARGARHALGGAAAARPRPRHLGGLLAFGAADGLRFHPDQGTDLLAFFAGVFERSLRRWLA